jgi:hemerythrin-like domain-containing protein
LIIFLPNLSPHFLRFHARHRTSLEQPLCRGTLEIMPVRIGATPESTFADPVGLLSDCHRRVEMFLGVLIQCSESERGESAPPPELGNALRYFRESAPKHTADEETSLFPRLAGNTEAMDIVRALEADHADAAPRHALIDRIGERWLAEGRIAAGSLADFRTAVQELAAMYRRHIDMEDARLFPLAERVLTEQQKREIGREMARRRGLAE